MKKNLKNSFECVQGRRSYKLFSLFCILYLLILYLLILYLLILYLLILYLLLSFRGSKILSEYSECPKPTPPYPTWEWHWLNLSQGMMGYKSGIQVSRTFLAVAILVGLTWKCIFLPSRQLWWCYRVKCVGTDFTCLLQNKRLNVTTDLGSIWVCSGYRPCISAMSTSCVTRTSDHTPSESSFVTFWPKKRHNSGPRKQGKLLIIIIITHKLLIIIIIIHNLEQLKVGQMDACLDKTQIGLNN